jgi:hypothetical protein
MACNEVRQGHVEGDRAPKPYGLGIVLEGVSVNWERLLKRVAVAIVVQVLVEARLSRLEAGEA